MHEGLPFSKKATFPMPPNENSPYDAMNNYRLFPEYFDTQVVEVFPYRSSSVGELKLVKSNDKLNPSEPKCFNRFDEGNVFNKFPYQFPATSRQSSQLNMDLPFGHDQQTRVKTSVGAFRTGPAKLHQINESVMKPETSVHKHKLKHKERQNRYYKMIEEALKMTSELNKHK